MNRNPNAERSKEVTMSNNKQSSVEWLAIELWEEMNMQGDGAIFNKLFEKAKAMHKEEIENALIDGAINERVIEYRIPHYYNETFEDESNT